MRFEAERADETVTIPSGIDPARAPVVLEELDRILVSPFFKNAVRSRQFLQYVVQQTLNGHSDRLKERTIGVEVFQRAPGYATGDDPVVRVQAGEVRRRLDNYYQAATEPLPVRIELPLGSYAPQIHWQPIEDSRALPPTRSFIDWIWKDPRRRWSIALLVLVLVAGLALAVASFSGKAKQLSAVNEFWEPAFVTPQPVFICLAKPVVYRPTLELYQKYVRSHPGTFQTEVERSNQVLPLSPDAQLSWSEMSDYRDYGVAVGDVYAAMKISAMLGQIRKPTQIRIGMNYSFADLRNSPSVIVGAFNNKWTMQLMPGLHFGFVEEGGNLAIREQTPGGRVWRSNLSNDQQSGVDYALVVRLLDSMTGQFTVIAAGITGSGTQTAGEFISNQSFLERGLRDLPVDWQKKNLELVLKTTVTDAMAGPPQVEAAFVW